MNEPRHSSGISRAGGFFLAWLLSSMAMPRDGTPAEAGNAQEDVRVTFTWENPSFKVLKPRPGLKFKGTCPIPDGMFLRISMTEPRDYLASDGQIVKAVAPSDFITRQVKEEHFSGELQIERPGHYTAEVEILNPWPELQKTRWQFKFVLWDDAVIGKAGAQLSELRKLIGETGELIHRFELATASEETWAGKEEDLVSAAVKLRSRWDATDLQVFHPVGVGYLSRMVRTLSNSAPDIVFRDGKFEGVRGSRFNRMTTNPKEMYSWADLKGAVDETLAVGGREFCLWILQELRRADGKMRPEILEAVESQKTSPGVERWAERLQKATLADLDGLEDEIRGKPVAGFKGLEKKPARREY